MRVTYDCPNCGTKMKFLNAGSYQCPNCMFYGELEDGVIVGDISKGDEYSYDSTFGDKPEVCRTCGGNYPDCKDSCSIFDD